ncbi:MAG: phosphoglucomutase/phosphomannomutase family protein, partial [Candidatus Dadabacteria bacterium]
MSFSEIRFGTDGWRAIIAETFTTDRVVAVVEAVLAIERVQEAIRTGAPIVVGADARFLADRFSWLVAERLAGAGVNVVLGDDHVATPGLGCEIVARNAALGVILTASHNPPEYLGIKIKGPWGGSATTDIYDEVAQCLSQVEPAAQVPVLPAAPPAGAEVTDLNATHLTRLVEFVKPSAGHSETIVHDAMYG